MSYFTISKRIQRFIISMVLLLMVVYNSSYSITSSPFVVHSFVIITPITKLSSLTSTSTSTSTTQLFFFGNGPKDDGSPGDYVCKDCGYVFTKGPKAWAALPDNYSCPPCGAPKRRFVKVPKGTGSSSGNSKKTTTTTTSTETKKKSWF